ncbi:MAG: AMP-binding protein, partial [Bacteroidota bacterium]
QPFGDRWEEYTWAETGQMARKLATGLLSLGLPPRSHIGLISKNCREWVIADLAITMANFVSVPLYPTLKADSVAELIELGDIQAMFVGKIEDWDSMKAGIPDDLPLIRFPHYEGNGRIERGEEWHSFIDRHEPWQGVPEFDPQDTWTIIFTSGTTGTPKGVVLSYGNLDSTKVVVEQRNIVNLSTEGDNVFFSFLPMNHIAERVLVEQGALHYGGTMSFAESLDSFVQNLQDVQPTFFFAVPRIWTKFQLGVLAKMPAEKLDRLLKIPLLNSLVKKRIRKGLGMGRVRGTITGAASIPEELKNWYRKIGIPMVEGYGMTENCALTSSLPPKDIRPGSVGIALPTVDMKIDPANGEIMMKAPFVMQGYYKDPEKTAEVLEDGWLRTGDQGSIDEEGYLYITGRVKDAFKTAKGKFLVPGPIEQLFETSLDIEQLCLVGLGCPQPLLLIVPSEIGLAKSQEALKDSLAETLTQANAQLPNYQKVSTVVVVREGWDVGNDMLTPTLKVKRNQVHHRYGPFLMGWHEQGEKVIWE